MKRHVLAASAALSLLAFPAFSQTVYNSSLPAVNGTFGAGVATTTTDANGTVTTVVGPGGGANRATATPLVGQWFQANVGGGGSAGITRDYSADGDGAAFFASPSSNGKADLQLILAQPVALSSLRSVSFQWYVDPASTGSAFAPVLRLDMRKNGAFAGNLVFEWIYQGMGAAPEGAWTTQAATLSSGQWWATNAALGPTFAAADGGVKTLAEWIAGNAGSDLTVVGVNIGIGSGWNADFAGAIDAVRFDFGTVSRDYNFAVVPEPATWAMMIAGFGLVGGAMRRRGVAPARA